MRRLLGVLRADANGEPERAPQPGLMQLTELVDTARAAGTNVHLTLSGEITRLPPGVDLSAYRILQEALTNARRHAPGAKVDVEIVYGADTLSVRVHDDGPGPGETAPDGHGLLGMRERALMAGGTLTVSGAAGEGFSVQAELPLTGRPSDDQRRRRRRPGDRQGRVRGAPPTQPDFAVVGTASDGEEAVRVCREQRPDVVLMDVRMPTLDGIEATRRLAEDGSPARVIVLTTFDLDEYVYDALGAGACGFLLKDVAAEKLFDAVRVVAAGDALLAPAVTRRLVSEFARLRPTLPKRPEAWPS